MGGKNSKNKAKKSGESDQATMKKNSPITEDRYGIIATLKIVDGKMEEALGLAEGHFTRQLDGREPNATGAAILKPLEDEPNTLRFWEQWKTKEDYDIHAVPNENLKDFFDNVGPHLDGAPDVVATTMEHFEQKATAGKKYGILVEFVVKDGKMEDLMKQAREHFERQLDGREVNATFASISKPDDEHPNTLRFLEQWETKTDYDPAHTESEHLKLFFESAGELWESVSVKLFDMQHYIIA